MASPAVPATGGPEFIPHADVAGSWLAVIGIAITAVFLTGKTPSDYGRFGAYGFGASLGMSLFCDLRSGGVRNLIRADVLALVAFYFLTFFEFLFPQPTFDLKASIDPLDLTIQSIYAALLGAVGLIIGRHLWKPKRPPLRNLLTTPIPPGALVAIYWAIFFAGYMHMLLAVDFDVVKMVKAFLEARFTQPWSRGRLGDWKALFFELGMFIYLVPPLAGVIIARRERYPKIHVLLVFLGLMFTLFYGFTGGTRNVLASYLVTLLIGYSYAVGPERRKEVLTVCALCGSFMLIATPLMLEFRNVGIRFRLSPEYTPPQSSEHSTVFVDYNIYNMSQIIKVFPKPVPYLGLEIPYIALIRPIPRAIWPGKPEGLSFSIENALNVENMTISATFAGESYMSGGMIAVLLGGLLFGALFGWWNYLGSTSNSELGILIYASGFFAAVITMRSLFAFTTALVPTAAAIFLTSLLVKQVIALERKLSRMRTAKLERAAKMPLPPGRRR